jgi:hypothetical protein
MFHPMPPVLRLLLSYCGPYVQAAFEQDLIAWLLHRPRSVSPLSGDEPDLDGLQARPRLHLTLG